MSFAEFLFLVPIVTVARTGKLLGVTRPIARTAIATLVEGCDLVEVIGRERRRIYEALQIFDRVYRSVDVDEGALTTSYPPT